MNSKSLKQVTFNVINPITVSVDDDLEQIIAIGKAALANGQSKAEVVRMIYPHLNDQPREIVWYCFIAGADLTPRGAITYFYNVRRNWKS